MSTHPTAFRSWPVGDYTVTLTIPSRASDAAPAAISITWDPRMPSRLTDSELNQYRAGRNAAIAELSAAMGLRVAVLDL